MHFPPVPALKSALIDGMKTTLLLLVLSVSPSVFARQSMALSPINFQIAAPNALSKFHDVVLNPEDILRRFKPAGVKISNKNVARNEISFTATKTVLVISKSVYVHGVLESHEASRDCYSLRMHFEGSSHLVTDNVEELQASLCVREESPNKITGQIRPQIILGDRYSRTLGPMAINLIKDQVQPLLTAVTEEIRSMR